MLVGDVDNFRVGTKPVKAVYLGEELVWRSGRYADPVFYSEGALEAEVQLAARALLSSAGALSSSVLPMAAVDADLSSDGQLDGTVSPQFARAAPLAGAGALSVQTVQKYVAAVSLSGSGSLSASVMKKVAVAASFSGGGTLSATAVRQHPMSVGLSGGGTLSATAAEFVWTPAAIPGLAAWIDPAQDLGTYTDGQAIGSYISHDPSGRVFTAYADDFASAGSHKPVYRASIVGGKPRIEFDIAAMGTGDGTYSPGPNGLTFVTVLRASQPGWYGMHWSYYSENPNYDYEMRFNNGNMNIQVVADYGRTSAAPTSAFYATGDVDYIYMMRVDIPGNSVKLWINDTLQFDAASATVIASAGDLSIGARRWSDGLYLYDALVAEALAISGPISDADRAKLVSYLRAKHGSLPAVT